MPYRNLMVGTLSGRPRESHAVHAKVGPRKRTIAVARYSSVVPADQANAAPVQMRESEPGRQSAVRLKGMHPIGRCNSTGFWYRTAALLRSAGLPPALNGNPHHRDFLGEHEVPAGRLRAWAAPGAWPVSSPGRLSSPIGGDQGAGRARWPILPIRLGAGRRRRAHSRDTGASFPRSLDSSRRRVASPASLCASPSSPAWRALRPCV